MKLSIFTTITNPEARGDIWKEAINCYEELADEVVIVDGSGEYLDGADIKTGDIDCSLTHKYYEWPQEFKWPFIGQQFQRGYEACTGDWVIHADLDFLFHEKDFEAIRKACELNNDALALSFYKYQFIQPDRYNLKSRLVIAVNKGKYGNRIRCDSGGDLCQPSLDGKYIDPSSIPEAKVPFYNYEKLTKTEEQVKDDVGRMDRAYKRHFGEWLYSKDGSDESAFEGWLSMALGRYNKPQKQIKITEHPKFIQETILNLKPYQFGYNAWGLLKENNYV